MKENTTVEEIKDKLIELNDGCDKYHSIILFGDGSGEVFFDGKSIKYIHTH